MDLHVAGALEFLVYDIVHPAAGLDEGGGDDGKAAAVFDVAGCAEEPLGLVKGAGVHAAGQGFAGGGDGQVIGPGQTGDGIDQHHHVLALLHQAHGPLLAHFSHPGMMLRQLVKGGIEHLALDGTLHIRHFLRPLVDKQHNQGHVGIIGRDAVGDVFKQGGLAALGLADDEAPLALADGGDQVDEADGTALILLRIRPLQGKPLVGVDGHQFLKMLTPGRGFRVFPVDGGDV